MRRKHSMGSPVLQHNTISKQISTLKEMITSLHVKSKKKEQLLEQIDTLEKTISAELKQYEVPPLSSALDCSGKKKHKKLRLWKTKGEETTEKRATNIHELRTRADSMNDLHHFLDNQDSKLEREMQENGIEESSFDMLQKRVMKLPIVDNEHVQPLAYLCGPDDYESEDRYGEAVSAQTISTYPHTEFGRSGDPICDRFYLQLYEETSIICLADGCNWGIKPREAAILACNEIVTFLSSRINTCVFTSDITNLLLKALMRAHSKILDTQENCCDAGTTTVLAGILVKLKEPMEDKEWVFVCVSVGDCKSFYYSQKEKCFYEITKGNRTNLTDASDCGGRLGPAVGDDKGCAPDLRNLKTYYALLDEGDIVVTVSDGVHDNLDPQLRGMKPSEFDIPAETWVEAEEKYPEQSIEAKSKFLINTLNNVVSNCENDVTPHDITISLISLAKEVTKDCREFMESSPSARQPTDYEKYPGKMDHTSCVSVRAQTMPKHPFDTIYELVNNPIALAEFKKFIKKENLRYPDHFFSQAPPSPKTMRATISGDIKLLQKLYNLIRNREISSCDYILNILAMYEKYKNVENKPFSRQIETQLATACHNLSIQATNEIEERVTSLFQKFRFGQWMKYECFHIKTEENSGESP